MSNPRLLCFSVYLFDSVTMVQTHLQNKKTHRTDLKIRIQQISALVWLCTLPVLHQPTPVFVCQSFGTSCRLSVVQAVPQFLPLLQSSHGQPQVLLQTLDLSLVAALHPTQLLVHLCVSFTGQPFLLQSKTAGQCDFTHTMKDHAFCMNKLYQSFYLMYPSCLYMCKMCIVYGLIVMLYPVSFLSIAQSFCLHLLLTRELLWQVNFLWCKIFLIIYLMSKAALHAKAEIVPHNTKQQSILTVLSKPWMSMFSTQGCRVSPPF